jgi:hypothetical protein
MGTVKINKPTDLIERKVVLCGLKEMMFDRYPGDNNTKLEPWQKLYFEPGDSKAIGLPATNIMSFLSAHNTNSAPKRLRDKRKFKDICNACLSFVSIEPDFIPIVRGVEFDEDGTVTSTGEPVRFGRLLDDRDPMSGIYIARHVARLDKGIPNPKERPVLPLPWALCFNLTLFPNREVKEQDILNLFEEGGRAIGLGTFRGPYGKFRVAAWE